MRYAAFDEAKKCINEIYFSQNARDMHKLLSEDV